MKIRTGLGLRKKINNVVSWAQVYKKQKIFCVGFNKTGTTSIKKLMAENGYIVGDQWAATKLIDYWAKRDFKTIINYCKTAQFFQDAPFSLPYTYIAVDQAFPDSKFILTVRSSAEEWYNSLVSFHAKLWGNGKKPPSADDLKKAPGPYSEFRYKARYLIHDLPHNDPYNKDILINSYKRHNSNVKDYFRHRPDDLMVINLSKDGDYQRFCDFLDLKKRGDGFPWENRTSKMNCNGMR